MRKKIKKLNIRSLVLSPYIRSMYSVHILQSPHIRSMYMGLETRYRTTQVVVHMDNYGTPTPCGRNDGVNTHLHYVD